VGCHEEKGRKEKFVQVQDIMARNVSSGSPQTNAAAVAEIMWTKNCGSLPIVEDDGRLVGMITDRDLFIALGTQNRRAAELLMGEVMRREPFVCAPGDDIRSALKTMAQEGVHRLPVVDESGALKGILSMDDVLVRTDSALKDEAIRTLKAICDRQLQNTRRKSV
jgi:CBS domain-containing protein